MPRYRFEFLHEPHTQAVFVELANDDAARTEAREALAESMLDRSIELKDVVQPAIKAYNDAGELVATAIFEARLVDDDD